LENLKTDIDDKPSKGNVTGEDFPSGIEKEACFST